MEKANARSRMECRQRENTMETILWEKRKKKGEKGWGGGVISY